MTNLLVGLATWVVFTITTLGYLGTFICMTIEGACIPLPSEIILTFSGFLVFKGTFNFALAVLAGALGNAFGSSIMYYVGKKGGYPFLNKFGKYFLISRSDLDTSEKWFEKYGNKTVFASQLLPVVRTYISLPSGILKIRYLPFVIYTFLGALVWSTFLVWLGMIFGYNWKSIEVYFKKFNLAISVLLVVCLLYFVYHKIQKFRTISKEVI